MRCAACRKQKHRKYGIDVARSTLNTRTNVITTHGTIWVCASCDVAYRRKHHRGGYLVRCLSPLCWGCGEWPASHAPQQ